MFIVVIYMLRFRNSVIVHTDVGTCMWFKYVGAQKPNHERGWLAPLVKLTVFQTVQRESYTMQCGIQ